MNQTIRSESILARSGEHWKVDGDLAPHSARHVVGAPAPVNSKDAAILVTLDPGSYTVVVSGVGNTTGVAIT